MDQAVPLIAAMRLNIGQHVALFRLAFDIPQFPMLALLMLPGTRGGPTRGGDLRHFILVLSLLANLL